MSFGDSARRFNALASRTRAEAWPVSFTIGNDTASPKREIAGSGSPATRTRVQSDERAGWIQRTVRTYALTRAQIPATATVKIKDRFTVTSDALNPENIGTVWQIFDLTDSNGGSELRAVAFRLD